MNGKRSEFHLSSHCLALRFAPSTGIEKVMKYSLRQRRFMLDSN